MSRVIPQRLPTLGGMTAPASSPLRVVPGQVLAPFTVSSLSHGEVPVPGPKLTHLQFHRFAGCPICNLHVHRFVARASEVSAAGVQVVVFFYSTEAEMRPFQGDLPFPAVADPQRVWFERFGVGKSLLASLHPAASWAAMKGLMAVKSNPMAGSGGMSGLPADFLIDTSGKVLAAQYGRHPAELWSVDDVLALARRAQV